jgi:MFS family permease
MEDPNEETVSDENPGEREPSDRETSDRDTSVLESEQGAPESRFIEQPIQSAAGLMFESLSFPGFRYFWIGAWLSNIGTWMQNTAQAWLVTQLTNSAWWVGAVGFAGGLPVLFLALPAGALADRLDRRRLLIVCQALVMLLAFWLAYLVQTTAYMVLKPAETAVPAGNWPLVWWVLAIGLLAGIVGAFNFPAWQAIVPDLVSEETLLNAIALNAAQFHAARLIGPAIAGSLIGSLGMASAFWANGVSFLFVIWALWVIRPIRRTAPRVGRESTWQLLTGGLSYARDHMIIRVLLLQVAILTFFGMPYVLLLSLFSKRIFGDSVGWFAGLLGANGLGAMIGALGVAYLARIAHRPTLIRVPMLVFSVTIILFSLSRSYPLSLALMVLAGAAFMTMQSATNTSLQKAAPPHIRGRVMALFVLAFMGVMPFGSLAFGALGAVAGVPDAIVVGAVVCLAWGLTLTLKPSLLVEAA